MSLTPEQQYLIRRRARASCPAPAAAYALWLAAGLAGGHRFYLGAKLSAAAMAVLALAAAALLAGGIAFGGTPLDGVFFEPDVADILRAAQSGLGRMLFYAGLAALIILLGWWLADAFALPGIIRRRRAAAEAGLAAFYAAYQPQAAPQS